MGGAANANGDRWRLAGDRPLLRSSRSGRRRGVRGSRRRRSRDGGAAIRAMAVPVLRGVAGSAAVHDCRYQEDRQDNCACLLPEHEAPKRASPLGEAQVRTATAVRVEGSTSSRRAFGGACRSDVLGFHLRNGRSTRTGAKDSTGGSDVEADRTCSTWRHHDRAVRTANGVSRRRATRCLRSRIRQRRLAAGEFWLGASVVQLLTLKLSLLTPT